MLVESFSEFIENQILEKSNSLYKEVFQLYEEIDDNDIAKAVIGKTSYRVPKIALWLFFRDDRRRWGSAYN